MKLQERTQQETDLNKVMTGRIQPQAIDLECAVLGACLVDSGCFVEVCRIIGATDFYTQAHQLIFSAMCNLAANSYPIDMLTVYEELNKLEALDKIGNIGYLTDLMQRVGSSANAWYHAAIIREKSIKRQLIAVNTQSIKDCFQDNETGEDLLTKLFGELEQIKVLRDISKNSDVVREIIDDAANPTKLYGIETGFKVLDSHTQGLSGFVVLAARPSMGKTALIMQIGLRNCSVKNPNRSKTLVFSLETDRKSLILRIMCCELGVTERDIKANKVDPKLLAKFDINDYDITIIDDTSINITDIISISKQMFKKTDRGMIIIDYIGLIKPPAHLANNPIPNIIVSEVSRQLKLLSISLPNTAVVALSQLSRAVETRGGDKRPMLSDLRDSGSIEQDAQAVFGLYRPDYYGFTSDDKSKEYTELLILKLKGGKIGTIDLESELQYMRFKDYQETNNGFTSYTTDNWNSSISREAFDIDKDTTPF